MAIRQQIIFLSITGDPLNIILTNWSHLDLSLTVLFDKKFLENKTKIEFFFFAD